MLKKCTLFGVINDNFQKIMVKQNIIFGEFFINQ